MGNFLGALIQGYVSPWVSLIPALTGLFLIGLFAFVAAIFL